ncbi:MAG: helix-turn-helix domain-containing protein [Acidobacteriota bacterium]
MTSHDSQLSLADLGSSGIAVHHAEAAAIVRELMRRACDGELPGVPSAQVIRLHVSGEISVEGPIATDDRAIVRAATLLQSLLPGFDAPTELRVPGALRLVIARALGTVDLPPYGSLQDFAGALERFASTELPRVVRDLVVRHAEAAPQAPEPVQREADAVVPDERDGSARAESESEAVEPAPLQRLEPRDTELTISDIRRARRATGLTLGQISERSRISARLLVELEWGYMRNWPASPVGRTQLVRYARAAGLDDRIVVRTVWPMLEEAARARPVVAPDVPEVALVPFVDALPRPLPAVSSTSIPDVPARPAGRRRYLAALAIPALLAVGIVPALWERSMRAHQPDATHQPEPAPATRGVVPPQPVSLPAARAGAAAAIADPASRPANGGRTDVASVAGPALAPAASPVRGLSDGPAYSPSFASVGTAMFYQAESGGRSALMRADTDSRGAILRITSIVDDRAHNFHARPSPDGDRIAFDSDRDGERGVYVADADGTNVRRISGDGFAAIPSWSPDGKTIAFVRGEDGHPKVWNLWTTDIESGQTRRLTSYRVGAPWGGSWFPDGRRLAYSHETELVVLDLESGKRRVFRSPVAGRLVRTPAVSPDGRRVMFQVYQDGAWLLDLPDGSMRKVLSDPSAEEYTWAPDGRRVAYHSRGTGTWGVWVMAPR